VETFYLVIVDKTIRHSGTKKKCKDVFFIKHFDLIKFVGELGQKMI
jgi:hypothetical protein